MKTEFTKQWIIDTGIPIVKSYNGNLTLRALHYRLVAAGMINDIAHYKKVVNAMVEARWEGLLNFDDFMDHERESLGHTEYESTTVESGVENAEEQIKIWATSYSKNKWENQPYYPEIFIEKKALQGVFEAPCKKWDVALNPCKGYPSLTFLYDAKCRFTWAANEGKKPIILYFGDYDCSGENIPETILANLNKMGLENIELKRIALMEHQVVEWGLPPAPTKISDTRSRKWDGIGQVELDAVEPYKIVELCEQSIIDIFDVDLYHELLVIEENEKSQFKEILIHDFKSLLD
jgi:hypothetical protein